MARGGKTATSRKANKAKATKEPADKPKRDVFWNKDPTLTDKLISSILEDAEIKQGLYSSVGGNASSSRGGGKSKSEHHWKLAQAVFGDRPEYADFITAGRTDAKERGIWTTKVKNRLQGLESTYAVHKETMGQTGAGIDHEDEIDMSLDNEFTNKWEKIKKEFPWFWDMKALVQERPSRVRVGLGNGDTDVDFSAIMVGAEPSNSSEDLGNTIGTTGSERTSLGPNGSESDDAQSDDDCETNGESRTSRKRQSEEARDESDVEQAAKAPTKPLKEKTPARSATPAKLPAKRPKIVESMSEIAVAEESTKKKEYDFRMKKLEVEKDKVAAKRAIKQHKAEILKMKLQQEHEREMERMRLQRLRYQASPLVTQPSFGMPMPGPSAIHLNPTENFDFAAEAFRVEHGRHVGEGPEPSA